MEQYQIENLSSEELKQINGGWVIPLLVAIGGVCAWSWSKGEAMGRALAKHH
jgi:lactobin A/cerein 7B family class IIb bacteriocin